FLTVVGIGLSADVRLLPEHPVDSRFMWQDLLRGQFMLLSMKTHRYLGILPGSGEPYAADRPGTRPDRCDGTVLAWGGGGRAVAAATAGAQPGQGQGPDPESCSRVHIPGCASLIRATRPPIPARHDPLRGVPRRAVAHPRPLGKESARTAGTGAGTRSTRVHDAGLAIEPTGRRDP